MSENKKNEPTKAAPRKAVHTPNRTRSFHERREDVGTTEPDLSATLDHILTVGAKIRHDNFRQNIFAATQEPRLQREYEATLDQPTTRPGAPPPAMRNVMDNLVHAEDVRLYGTNDTHPNSMTQRFNGLAQYPWPGIEYESIPLETKCYLRPPTLTADDTPWNLEHGDSIHPLAFSKAKLSGLPLEDGDRAYVHGNNMFLDKTDTAVEDAEVPRALLLRCWERAVHAASNTSCVPLGGGQADRLPQQQQQQPQPQVQSSARQETRRSTKRSNVETSTQGQKQSQDMEHHEQPAGQEPISSRTRDRPTQIGTGASYQPLELEVEPVGTATAQSVNPVRLTATTRGPTNAREREQALRLYIQNLKEAGGPRFGETAHDYSRTAALKKCKEWTIRLPKKNQAFTCQNCKLKYETLVKLDAHFHGIGNQQGCCWNVIHKKQREKLDAVLQENIKGHIQAILELVMSKAKDKIPPKGAKRARLINWYDILQYAESEYEQARVIEGSPKRDHPVLETMEIIVYPNRSPLVLNQMVLDALRRRLIDRYADVPI
jgi:hypothetical protein